jgi:molybdate transport system substrate-binding protein
LRSSLRHAAVALAVLAAFGCRKAPPPPPARLSVLAAASLGRFAHEAAEAFQAKANAVVEVRTGGTEKLAAELSSTRSADLFLAAGLDSMNRLEEQGLIVPESRWEVVGNRMVILGREEAGYPPVRFVDVATLGFTRFVVPDPQRDPAGRYARRWLEHVGARGESVWRQLATRRQTVDTVAEVLQAVANDPSTVGVVFASDIGHIPTGKVLFRSPDLGIRYSFALVNRAGRPPEARQLLDFLRSPAGVDLLQKNGFLVEPNKVKKRPAPPKASRAPAAHLGPDRRSDHA